MSIRQAALSALQARNLDEKVAKTAELRAGEATFLVADDSFAEILAEPANIPGRPEKPELFAHFKVSQASITTPRGLAQLFHAVCHIEFNAINLALDAVWRYPKMPLAYYQQWTQVAAEEAHHFSLLRSHLQSMGFDYGDFPAHNSLWDMCERTKGDIIARMALVPRTLEARGLDATPPMQAKLRKVGSADALEAVKILDIILRDEVGHVAIGNHWYRWLCEREGLDPVAHFRQLIVTHSAPKLRAPINHEARRMAGFTDEEIAALVGVDQAPNNPSLII